MATATSRPIVVGTFDDPAQARRAIADLRKEGYTDDQIGVLSHNRDGSAASSTETGTNFEEGAAVGAATGAGVGALWGLAILAGVLPGIGPAIAGGTLGVLLSSAAAGAAAAGIGGALVGLGVPEEDAAYYEGEYKAGRTIVTVQGEPKAGYTQDVFTRYGGVTRVNKPR
jgi:hypothetical protein